MNSAAYLEDQLRETFRVVDTCLACIYGNQSHMYRALAGQLRQLLCDGKNSLLGLVRPDLYVTGLAPIAWSANRLDGVELRQASSTNASIATMPFEVTIFRSGLVIADCQFAEHLVPISDWPDQALTVHPHPLTARDVIRAVADKGGGAHVDAQASLNLRFLHQKAVGGRTYAELFSIALGRFVQRIGEVEFKYPIHRAVDELRAGLIQKQRLGMVANNDLAKALSDHLASKKRLKS